MTPKQARFVKEYLIDLNATQAAMRAGYSARTANEQAAQLLQKPELRAAIDAGKVDRSEKTKITSDRVLEEISIMAFYDPASIMVEIGEADPDLAAEVSVSEDGKIYGLRGPSDVRRLPENVRRAIVGWGYDRNQNFTIKLADKSKALDQLARHLSLYNDKLTLHGVEGLADRLARATRPNDQPVAPIAKPAKPVIVPDEKPTQAKQIAPRQVHQAAVKPRAAAAIAAKPQYEPILPAWPAEAGTAAVDYDPTMGSYDLK